MSSHQDIEDDYEEDILEAIEKMRNIVYKSTIAYLNQLEKEIGDESGTGN